MPIQKLENSVIDQIAAGEVVDRPAHMIKELVENSIDAGAKEVSVHFSEGGRNVRIADDGSGISSKELALAVARHATSKIAATDDLWNISSYGFRGEALASIAAVSDFRLTSRPEGQDSAAQIAVKYGAIQPIQEVGGEAGTVVEVAELFKNTPARLKFLKSDSAEAAQVKNQLKALALANLNVTFRVYYEDELVYFWPAQTDRLARTKDVLGEPELYIGEAKLDGFMATAVVSSPNRTLGHSRQIWLLVQGRFVQDRGLQAAVLEGYRNFLMHGEFPVAAIYLQCDPEDLDVNVSPTKSQVRFRDASTAFRVVQRAVRSVLESAPWVSSLLSPSNPTAGAEGAETAFDFNLNRKPAPSLAHQTLSDSSSVPTSEHTQAELFTTSYIQSYIQSNIQSDIQPKIQPNVPSRVVAPRWADLEILGQAHQTYIVAQNQDSIIYIDQHAAHERIMFEKLMSSIRAGQVEVQSFLIAPVVDVSEDAAQALVAAKNELSNWGLHIDLIGPTQIAVNAAPALARPEALPLLIEKMANEYMGHGGSHSLESRLADRIATLACHSAIRAGQSLGQEEMKALLVQMDEFSQSSFCPHGRPVFVEYPFRKLERDFGRIV